MKLNRYYFMLLITVAQLIYGCGHDAPTKGQESSTATNADTVQLTTEQAKNAALQVAAIMPKNISTTVKLSGQIDVPPQNLVSVSIPLGGYLRSTKMLPGSPVQKGQAILVMEDPQYIQLQQDYLSIKNKLDYAGKEYARQKELNASKASSDKVLQLAEIEFKNLKIEASALAEKLRLIGLNPLQLTEHNITRSIVVRSPISGYISKVNVNIGKYVTPSDVIFELVDPRDIHLNLTVFEKDLDKIEVGQSVYAYTNGKPDQKYLTKVILINHNLNADRSTEIHCHFEKYDKRLVPGMYMNAELALSKHMVNVLPSEAIVNFENKNYVFVAIAPLTFKMVEVEIGENEDSFTEIKTDLKGQKVAVKGAYALLMKLKNTADEE